MNHNAKKWVDALRSGKFKQGTNMLSNATGGTHCCLGVACVLYQEDVGDLVMEEKADGSIVYDGDSALLGEKVCAWLNLKAANGGYRDVGVGWKNLSAQNDEGATFDEIADIIESEPRELFYD